MYQDMAREVHLKLLEYVKLILQPSITPGGDEAECPTKLQVTMEGKFPKMPVITSGGKQWKVDLEEMLREYLTVYYSTWLSNTCHHSPLISEQNWLQLIDKACSIWEPHI